VRERHPFATTFLVLFYLVQVNTFAILVHRTFGLMLSLESGFVLVTLVVLTWITLMWSLEAIRRWNRLGFFLYLASCAAALMLQWWASVAGIPVPTAAWMRLVISPAILWFFVLQVGSPSTWWQMDRHSLLSDIKP
jgi:hypothetical protein